MAQQHEVTPAFEIVLIGIPRSVGWKGNPISVQPRSPHEVDTAVFDAVQANGILGKRLERIARTWGNVEFRVVPERGQTQGSFSRNLRAWYASAERSTRVRVVLARRHAGSDSRENLWLDQERADGDALLRWKLETEAHLEEMFGEDATGMAAREYCFDAGHKGRVPMLRLRGSVPHGWKHPVELAVMRTTGEGSTVCVDGGVLLRARKAIRRHEAGTPQPSKAEAARESTLRTKLIRLGPQAFEVPEGADANNAYHYTCGTTSKEVETWLRKHEADCACGCARCATLRALPPRETAHARSQTQNNNKAAMAWANQIYETETGVAHVSVRGAACTCPM